MMASLFPVKIPVKLCTIISESKLIEWQDILDHSHMKAQRHRSMPEIYRET